MFKYKINIEVTITEEDYVEKTIRRESLGDTIAQAFESAEESLGKLQRACEREELK